MNTAAIIDLLQRALPGAVFEAVASADQPTIFVKLEHLVASCQLLRDAPELQLVLLADVTAADYWPREPRFEVVYHLASIGVTAAGDPNSAVQPMRLRLKVRVAGDPARVPTLSAIWPAADWAEREVWDMFGIAFDGHPDLRRILMPEDWDGYPLRKDYPVQVNLPPRVHEPLQVTEEEFARNVRAARYVPGTPRHETAPGGRTASGPDVENPAAGTDTP
jgi:NADH-quinone oxidoreductase subunit C